MKRFKLGIFLSVLTICVSATAQEADSSSKQASLKAQQILQKSKEVLEKSISINDINGWSAVWTSRSRISASVESNSEFKDYIRFPDKLKRQVTQDFESNIIISHSMLNGDKVLHKTENLVNGVPIQLESNNPANNSPKQAASNLKESLAVELLPILLDGSPLDRFTYEYIGEASSKDGKADVIKVISKDRGAYMLYFDKTSHLLLLSGYTSYYTPPRRSPDPPEQMRTTKVKMFFSDYREKDGFLIAHKIVTEVDGEVVSEKDLKEFTLNPVFASGFFDF